MSSAEQTMHARRGGRAAVEARYVQAARALALREAEFLALDAAGGGAAAKLERLSVREKAARTLADAERSVIGAMWADGTLTHATCIGEAVKAVLAALREEAIASA